MEFHKNLLVLDSDWTSMKKDILIDQIIQSSQKLVEKIELIQNDPDYIDSLDIYRGPTLTDEYKELKSKLERYSR